MSEQRPTAVISGASAGIGASTAKALAPSFDLILGARREDRLRDVAEPLGARCAPLDVTDEASIADFCNSVERCELLVNNAGAAFGVDPIAAADPDDWRRMYELNVLGILRMTRALLPKLLAARGHVVNVGSTSGFETYPGGGGYTGTKHAVRALTRTLREEILGEPVRVTEICPGLVETEFSLVRFTGDEERARQVYEDMTPLTAADVAEAIRWAAAQPAHVNIDEIVIRPLDQAAAGKVYRRDA